MGDFLFDFLTEVVYNEDIGVIAQLIRALPLQGRGPGFESLLLHHIYGDNPIMEYSSALV